MRLLVAVLAVTALVASCDAGSKCTWGPSYWCQSPATAKECGRETYCQQSVWMVKEKKSLGGAGDCEICKLVVEGVEKLIEDNSTEVEVRTEVEKVCVILGPLAGGCRDFINEYFDQIWKAVFEQIDAERVCTLIKMCASTYKSQQLLRRVKAPAASLCDLCKLAANFLRTYVDSNSTESEVEKAVEGLCNILPGSAKTDCIKFISENFDSIWQLVKNDVDSGDICKQLGFCNSTLSSQLMVKKVRVKTDLCDLCQIAAKFLKTFVDGNKSEDEVKGALEEFCKILPKSLSSNCSTLVDKYFFLMWIAVKAEVDSGEVCKQIKLCNGTSSTQLLVKKVRVKQTLCDICKLVASFIKPYVDNNSTETEVKEALDTVCGLLPSTVSKECTDFVDNNFDQIWKLVQQEVDSGDICKMLGLCNSTLSTRVTLKQMKNVKVKQNLCDICKLVVSFIKPYVDNNSTEEEVKQAVDQLCSILPSAISSECTQLVDQNFDAIWKLFESEFDNDLICKQIGLCNSTQAKMKNVRVKQSLCDICELVVNFIKPYVDNNSTEEEVKQAVDQLCSILPSAISSECTQLVDQNFDAIWKLFESEFDNDLICKQIGLCNSTQAKVKAVRRTSVSDDCHLCEAIVSFVAVFVDAKATQQEVKDGVEKFCELIKSTECTTLVNQYFILVWQLVEGEVNNDEICKQINVCPSAEPLKLVQVKLPDSDTVCDVCKEVVPYLRKLADSSMVETEAKAAVEAFCGDLPSALQGTCTALIDNYFPMLWKLIQSYVDDEQICQEIGLCPKSLKSKAPQVLATSDLSTVQCTLCEFVIKELVSILDGNTTEAAIEAALDKVCDILPSTIKDLCDSFVKQYAPEIVKLLASELDPDKVCTALGLCTSSIRLASPNVDLSVKTPLGIECTLCEFVMKELFSLLNGNTTEAAIEAALDKVCDILPKTIRSDCEDFVKEYAPEIVKLISQEVTPDEICTALGLCSSSKPLQLAATTSVKGSVECTLCEFVMKELISLLNGNTTEAAIEAALDKVCDILPKTIRSDCEDFVKEYAPEIVKLITQEVTPDEICTALGLCSSSKPLKLAATTSIKGSVECTLCEFVMKELISLLNGNTTEAAIEAALDKVCDILPKTIRSDCEDFVKEYAPEIVKLITQEVTPDEICTALGLCSSSKPLQLAATTSVKGSVECTLCEFVMKELISLLNGNTTEAAIEAALDKVCDILPKTIRSDCEDFVKEYAPEIVKLITQEVTPDEICTALGLCSSSKPLQLAATTSIKDSIECVICEFVMKELESLLNKNSTEAEIEAALDKVCSLLPKTVQSDCDEFMKEYAPEILKLLTQELDPKTVCSTLGLCSSSKPLQRAASFSVQSGPLCIICEYVMKELTSFIDNNSSQADIEKALDKVCTVMPSTIKKECTRFVADYTPMIMKLLLKQVAPTAVCTVLRLCLLPEQPVALLKTPKSVSECVVCTTTLSMLKTLIGTGASKSVVEDALEEVCNLLPKEIVTECKSFVKEYSGQIIQLVDDEINPDKFCKDIGLCKNSKKATKILMQPWLKLARSRKL